MSEVDEPLSNNGKTSISEPTETSPLLPSHSASSQRYHDPLSDCASESASAAPHPRHSPCSVLAIGFCAAFGTCLLVFLLIIFQAYSYAIKASKLPTDRILSSALVFQGPNHVAIINASTEDHSIWLQVDARVGINAGSLLDAEPGISDTFLPSLRKAFTRWSIRRLSAISVRLDTISVFSGANNLADLDFPPLELDVTDNPPTGFDWLTPMSIPVRVLPSQDPTAWLDFIQESWKSGSVVARASISRVMVQGGSLQSTSWRSKLVVERADVSTNLRMKCKLLCPSSLPLCLTLFHSALVSWASSTRERPALAEYQRYRLSHIF